MYLITYFEISGILGLKSVPHVRQKANVESHLRMPPVKVRPTEIVKVELNHFPNVSFLIYLSIRLYLGLF